MQIKCGARWYFFKLIFAIIYFNDPTPATSTLSLIHACNYTRGFPAVFVVILAAAKGYNR
jgi:hypothetical protein